MAPPYGPSSTFVRPLQIVATPTQPAEWVAVYTYPSSAALYSQLPICEAALAPIKARAPGIARTSRYARTVVSPIACARGFFGAEQFLDRAQLGVPAGQRRLQPIHSLRPAHPGQHPGRPPQMLRLRLPLQRMLPPIGKADR